MTWIRELLTATSESESPRKYFYWAGLSAIAAVVKNKVYLDKFYYKLYPNIYVLLVGRSGLRKGPPVALAKQLVQEVNNTRVISGRNSIQAVIKDLATAITKPGSEGPITDAVGFLVSSEFASFIIQDPQALTILTDLYDGHYHTEWVNVTKTTGAERLKHPTITMIGASNEIHFKDAVPDNALGGGFVARTFIIYADKKSGINPLTERPEKIIPVKQLSKHLHELSKLSGEFAWSYKGKELYDRWYREFSEKNYTDTTGTMERLHDHILKAAMLISLSRGTSLELDESDIREAILACEDFVPGARKVALGQTGSSVSASGTAVLLKELLSRADQGYAASRDELLRKHWAYFDVYELDRITESLITGKNLEMIITVNGVGKKEISYKLSQKVVDNYTKLQES